ncbi:MAG: hypothetical protein WCA56_04390 [Xanthobacteraceae bacterium]|jgi:hypothetical protein
MFSNRVSSTRTARLDEAGGNRLPPDRRSMHFLAIIVGVIDRPCEILDNVEPLDALETMGEQQTKLKIEIKK